MNRCGDEDCRLPIHAPLGIPSNARRPHAHPFREFDRRERRETMPRPMERADWTWQLVAEAFVVFVAIAGFVVLASIVAVR